MIIFDLESDGLLPEMTKVHCLSHLDRDTQEHLIHDPASVTPLEDTLRKLQEADILCGHNVIGFDIPALGKLYPWFAPKGKVRDTMVWARVAYPDVKNQIDFALWRKGKLPGKLIGSHSLKAWGYRLGVNKGDFGETTDWRHWTPEMSTYCKQDVVVTHKLVQHLEKLGIPEECLELEHQVQTIISRQERHGVGFDVAKAQALYREIKGKQEKLLAEIQKNFKPFWTAKASDRLKPFVPKKNNSTMGYIEGAACTRVKLVEFNPGSAQHIYQYLIKHFGWKPTEFTEKSLASPYIQSLTGNEHEPKIDDVILKALPFPEAKPLAEYQMLCKRLGQLSEGKQAWLKKVTPAGRIHGSVNTNGAVSGRMTHFDPNLGQVPNNHAPYGPECRGLFIGDLVGCDAEGLELRCLGHFLARYDGGSFGKAVVEGDKAQGTDAHSMNAKALGCTRDTGKTYIYGLIYGAGMEKLGSILAEDDNYKDFSGSTEKLGRNTHKKLMENFPALKKLTDAVKEVAKTRKWLKGLDGRKVPCRSPHSALNTLLQGAGALVMKKALCILDDALQYCGYTPGTDYEFVLNIHDEFQAERLNPEVGKEFIGQLAKDAITAAGDYYGFRCRLDGEYKLGMSWAETH